MVNIPLIRKLALLPGEKIPEWVILELQGDLQTECEILAGQEIGTLHLAAGTSSPQKSSAYGGMDSSFRGEGKAIFLIGNYALTGEIVSLKKPLALLRKAKQAGPTGDFISILEVDAVVRKKILFRERPRHIIPSCALPKTT
ncbi:hypothetical protein BV898_14300 [Hypsibius exemplaris]|uniref:Chromosome transmission fidelity protein 8-like protein n=1 Tax=Hypsibius exemplaris TaxID=2072580 RepID=A0A1W0W8A7_HYPEX|nr:hypothetical protein BV898_14300 [Hypsibius exemplaris]